MTIYRATISDDRPCDSHGPVETQQTFAQRADAVKWLADWIGDDVQGNDDLDEQVADRLLALHENGRYDELISEYPGLVKVSWSKCPLRIVVVEDDVHEDEGSQMNGVNLNDLLDEVVKEMDRATEDEMNTLRLRLKAIQAAKRKTLLFTADGWEPRTKDGLYHPSQAEREAMGIAEQ
jgi:hypothetical protein